CSLPVASTGQRSCRRWPFHARTFSVHTTVPITRPNRIQCPVSEIACPSAAAASRLAALLLLEVSLGYDFVVAPCPPGAAAALVVKRLRRQDTSPTYS